MHSITDNRTDTQVIALTSLIAALRSGEYKQAHKRLRDGDAFCCLGLGCEIMGIGRWERVNNGQDDILIIGIESYEDYPPSPRVRQSLWALLL